MHGVIIGVILRENAGEISVKIQEPQKNYIEIPPGFSGGIPARNTTNNNATICGVYF